MTRLFALLVIAATALSAPATLAQDGTTAAKSQKAAAAPKIGKDQKTCRHKFPDGKATSWVCKKEEPCCAWDAIRYVKCGSTITGCL